MQWIDKLAEDYASTHTSPLDDVLMKIYEDTMASHPHAHMISGPVQGKFLECISSLLQPKYILEIGTFTGFSAICLAAGLQAGGELHTIELREEDADTAWKNITAAGMNDKIHLHTGDAREIVKTLPHRWDLVFIDADKTSYITYYEEAVMRLSERGLILADNVLFHGEVLEEKTDGKSAKAIAQFNNHVLSDQRTEQVLLTIRDGLLLIKKKS
ncbi:O-methyltransferase [Parafilimonas sp.]|uniref:O-methyltransferase n=1 Tax=Parafilimonas sp. TaxID=1969739 RepID=UPI0039E4BB5B